MSRTRTLLIAVAAGALAAVGSPASAGAAATFGACPDATAGFECATVPVPLDRAGATPGTISLAARRAPLTPGTRTATAVVPLAGGPGQAATPFSSSFRAALAPALTTRDLLVFDQRGTGRSTPLSCSALTRQGLSEAQAVAGCAAQLGPARAFFRTAESVADIETLRVEAGYDKLVLYGVSYGTKVALAYAAAYPQRVEALVLDSVLPADGPDTLRRATFAEIPRVLGELCAGNACPGLRGSIGGVLSQSVRRLARGSARGRVTAPDGSRLTFRVTEQDIFDILLAGDLNPALRAELPASLRAYLDGDRTPLARLAVRARGLTGVASQQASLPDNDALFLATRCEESLFPFDRAAGRDQRLAQARAAIAGLPAAAYAPFSPAVALGSEMTVPCASWPVASPPPAATGPLPAVPTLILEGSTDLRTPLLNGRLVAQQVPGARVLNVPFAGHSVLGGEPAGCAGRAVQAFFAGQPVADCPAIANPFSPTSRPPTRLSRVSGRTKAARTVNALLATLTDVRRQFIGDALAAGTGIRVGSRTGGLRAGFAEATRTGFRFRRVSYVPDVRVTGFLSDRGTSSFTISGSAAARGRVRITASGRISGTLGGKRISGSASRALAARRSGAADGLTGRPGPIGPVPRVARPLAGLAR